jgi:hypothetical protein
MDQVIFLKLNAPDIIQALFFRKMLGYIRDLINLKDYKNLYDITQRCNEVWDNRGVDTGIMSAAVPVRRSQSLARSDR